MLLRRHAFPRAGDIAMQQKALMRSVVQLKRVCVKANWQTPHDKLAELEKASK
jgi:hypothetical protein